MMFICVWLISTLDHEFSVTYYLELCNAISNHSVSHTLPKNLISLVGHYKIVTNLLGNNITPIVKRYSTVQFQIIICDTKYQV